MKFVVHSSKLNFPQRRLDLNKIASRLLKTRIMPSTTLGFSVTRGKRRWSRHPSAGFNNPTGYLLLALFALFAFWIICCYLLLSNTVHSKYWVNSNDTDSLLRGGSLVEPHSNTMKLHQKHSTTHFPGMQHDKVVEQPPPKRDELSISMKQLSEFRPGHLLSRQKSTETPPSNGEAANDKIRKRIRITTDVRGNLGPPEVMIQDPPGKDWIKDRWQAASNMHGTAIPGSHWVQLEFPEPILVQKVVLDWEAAHADDYVLYGSMDPITIGNDKKHTTLDSGVHTLFDGTNPQQRKMSLSVEETGQSPGVKTKTPLHVIHTITMQSGDSKRKEQQHETLIRYLKIWIQRPGKHGWGVSLWQVDVYGLRENEIMQ